MAATSRTLVALTVCVFGVTTGEFVIAGILPDVAGELGVSIPAAGLLVTAYALGMIAGGPLLTASTSRFARKPVITVLLVVAIAGSAASAIAPSYGVLFAARIAGAFVTSTFFANAIVIATSQAEPDKRASTVAKLAFGMNLAMIVGAPLGTVLADALGWRSTFIAIGICCLVGLGLVRRFVPAGGPGVRGSALAEFGVFRSREVRLAIAVTAVANAGLLMVFTYFAPLLTDLTGFPLDAVPLLLLVYGVGATLGNLVGGRLSDRAPAGSQLALLAALTAVLVLLWLSSHSAVVTALLVFAAGAIGFAVIPGMQTRVLTTASAGPTLAIAVNASAYQLAAAVAGWLGGRVIAATDLRTVYLAAAAITVAGIALSLFTWTHDRASAPSGYRPNDPCRAQRGEPAHDRPMEAACDRRAGSAAGEAAYCEFGQEG